MHTVIHLIVFVVAGTIFLLLTGPAELSGDRQWKTHLSHVLLLCAILGFGARLAEAGTLEAGAMVGSFASLLCLGFLWVPNFAFMASRGVEQLLYGDGRGGSACCADFREAREHIKEQEWAEAIRMIEPELAKEPKDFEGLRLLAEACVQLKLFGKAQAKMEIILNNPDATNDQKAWAKSEQSRFGNCQRTAISRGTRPSRFVSA